MDTGKTGRKFFLNGFTLAEALITLGIIGVIAAMTIPVLITNVICRRYSTQFKKAVSTLSQAARMSQVQYGFDYAGISNACSSSPKSDNPEVLQSICALLNGTLAGTTVKRYSDFGNSYKITSSWLTGNYTLSSDTIIYLLSDGTLVGINPDLGHHNSCSRGAGEIVKDKGSGTNLYRCTGFIDVNGISKPNKEVSCSSGSNSIENNDCIVKMDASHLTDIFPIRFHDGIVEPATASVRYILKNAQ